MFMHCILFHSRWGSLRALSLEKRFMCACAVREAGEFTIARYYVP